MNCKCKGQQIYKVSRDEECLLEGFPDVEITCQPHYITDHIEDLLTDQHKNGNLVLDDEPVEVFVQCECGEITTFKCYPNISVSFDVERKKR